MTVPAARVVFSDRDRQRILGLVDRSLQEGSLTLGSTGVDFETAFAQTVGAAEAVSTSSGTAALEIILRVLDVAAHDVVVPANTFFATAAAVLHAGGRVRFADADPATLSVSARSVADAITADTTAVVVVHIGGMVCPDIDQIAGLCQDRGIALVEDAAHAHGSRWGGRPAGRFSRAAAFSFYPTKLITSGEGGMIVTDDPSLAAEARIYRDQGKGSFLGGGHLRLGAAWRMSDIHAAIGLVHLDRLDEFVAVRRDVARRYEQVLSTVDGVAPVVEPVGSHRNVYKYPVLLDRRIDQNALRRDLDGLGVALSGKVYATALHHEPIFSGLDGSVPPGGLQSAEDVCARHVCLPVHSDMTSAEVEQVIDGVVAAVGEQTRRW